MDAANVRHALRRAQEAYHAPHPTAGPLEQFTPLSHANLNHLSTVEGGDDTYLMSVFASKRSLLTVLSLGVRPSRRLRTLSFDFTIFRAIVDSSQDLLILACGGNLRICSWTTGQSHPRLQQGLSGKIRVKTHRAERIVWRHISVWEEWMLVCIELRSQQNFWRVQQLYGWQTGTLVAVEWSLLVFHSQYH